MQDINKFIKLQNDTLLICGHWDVKHKITTDVINYLPEEYLKAIKSIDTQALENLDSVGCVVLLRLIQHIQGAHQNPITYTIKDEFKNLFTQFETSFQSQTPLEQPTHGNLISEIGRGAMFFIIQAKLIWQFLLEIFFSLKSIRRARQKFGTTELSQMFISGGIGGIFISSILCFLIGVTLTYQIAPQFQTYGANLYIVNFLGIALLREVTPLLTAVIVAGRSGSAISAEVGIMKIQEELDALKTMGISPVLKIYLPKICGLILIVPILTAIADVFSMFGGLIVAKPLLGVEYGLFLERVQEVVSINNYLIGIFKTFFFGAIIGIVGCVCGNQVTGDARSVGNKTTLSVVMSIFLIVLFDAGFAILFQGI